MKLQLTLAARLTLIILIALTAAWLGSIAIAFRVRDAAGTNARPAPQQIAALATLIERSPAGLRSTLIAAANGPGLTVRVEEGDTRSDLPAAARSAAPAMRQIYADSLNGRPFLMVEIPRRDNRAFSRLYGATMPTLEFRVGLATNETLVVDAVRSGGVTPFGLPVGFGAGLFGTLVRLLHWSSCSVLPGR